MAGYGPVPKRSEERIRRNKPEVEITKIEAKGSVPQPNLGLIDDEVHPIIKDFWNSIGESAQTKYYEPTDWQMARVTMHMLNKLLWQSRPSAQLLQVVHSMMGDLLVSEGARRRLRIEIEREAAKAEVVDIAKLFEERFKA